MNLIIALSERALQLVLGIITLLLITKNLPIDDYAIFSYGLVVVQVFAIFSLFVHQDIIVKQIKESPNNCQRIIHHAFLQKRKLVLWFYPLFTLGLLLKLGISKQFFVCILFLLTPIIEEFSSIYNAYFIYFQKNYLLSIARLTATVFKITLISLITVMTFITSVYEDIYWFYIVIYLLTSIVFASLMTYFYKKSVKKFNDGFNSQLVETSLKIEQKNQENQWGNNITVGIATGLSLILLKLDREFAQQSFTISEFGVYALASQFNEQWLLVGSLIGSLLAPQIFNQSTINYKKIGYLAVGFLTFSVMGSCILYHGIPVLFNFFFDAQKQSASSVFTNLVWLSIPYFLNQIAYFFALYNNKIKLIIMGNLIAITSFVALFLSNNTLILSMYWVNVGLLLFNFSWILRYIILTKS